MAIDILMPALSPTMEEGTLAKWLVSEGDTIKSGDILAEIETDKATMEFEAVDDGVIGQLLVTEGIASVSVNSVIAILLQDDETMSDVKQEYSHQIPVKTKVLPEPILQKKALSLYPMSFGRTFMQKWRSRLWPLIF